MPETWFDDVLKFVRASGRHISPTPNPNFPDLELRMRLITEEYDELTDAVFRGDLPDSADAIVDLIYVLCGAAASWGLDIREVWKEVQAANMRKFDHPDGPHVVNNKIVKPPGWVGPNVEGALLRGYISPCGNCEDLSRTREDWDSSMPRCSCEGSCACHLIVEKT